MAQYGDTTAVTNGDRVSFTDRKGVTQVGIVVEALPDPAIEVRVSFLDYNPAANTLQRFGTAIAGSLLTKLGAATQPSNIAGQIGALE